MTELFLKLFNMSLSSVWIVCAVFLIRAVFRRAPKRIFPVLWGLAGIRLLLPVTLKTKLSLIPSAEPLPEGILTSPSPEVHTGFALLDSSINPVLSASLAPAVGDSVNPMQVWMFLAAVVWAVGLAVMISYAAVITVSLRIRLREARKISEGVWSSPWGSTAFVLGIVKPRIYLPDSLRAEYIPYVLDHEQAHIRRGDHLYKPLAFLLLSIHWFNPFLWLAYVLLCRDIEMACDEKVVKDYAPEERAAYSESLLACSSVRRHVAACPLAFGEVSVKTRVKRVLDYKKPAFWAILLSLAAAAALAVFFLTDPPGVKNPAVGDYIPGVSRGNVDPDFYTSVSPDFELGADRNGYAVFRDPEKALETFRSLYAEELELVASDHGLAPLSERTAELYKVYAAQTERSDSRVRERLSFVAKFLDIWENSYKSTPAGPDGPPTQESYLYEPAEVPDSVWLEASLKAEGRSVTISRANALSRETINGILYIFPTEEVGPSVTVLKQDAASWEEMKSAASRVIVGYEGDILEKSGSSAAPPLIDNLLSYAFSSFFANMEDVRIDGVSVLRPDPDTSASSGDFEVTVTSIELSERIVPDGSGLAELLLVGWDYSLPGDASLFCGDDLCLIVGQNADTPLFSDWFYLRDAASYAGEKQMEQYGDPLTAALWKVCDSFRYDTTRMAYEFGYGDGAYCSGVNGLAVDFGDCAAAEKNAFTAPALRYLIEKKIQMDPDPAETWTAHVTRAELILTSPLSGEVRADEMQLWEIEYRFEAPDPGEAALARAQMKFGDGSIVPKSKTLLVTLVEKDFYGPGLDAAVCYGDAYVTFLSWDLDRKTESEYSACFSRLFDRYRETAGN